MQMIVNHEVRHKQTGEQFLLVAIDAEEGAIIVKQDHSFAWLPLTELESISYPGTDNTETDIRKVSGMSSRSLTALLNNNIFTVEALTSKTFRELRKMEGVGPATASDIRETLRMHGWTLKPTTRDRQGQEASRGEQRDKIRLD